MRNLKTGAALSLCLAAAACTAAQQQNSVNGAAVLSPIACNAIYSANAAKDALCQSISGQLITVAQAVVNGEAK